MSEQTNGHNEQSEQWYVTTSNVLPERDKLFAALAKARREVDEIQHDARNEFHKFNYTSAEAVIKECSRVLAENGIAVIPTGFTYNITAWGKDKNDNDLPAEIRVMTRWLVSHESGQCIELQRDLSAVPGSGRPADKAELVANTTLLSYLLRDLCGASRPSEAGKDDVSGRDDRDTFEPTRTRGGSNDPDVGQTHNPVTEPDPQDETGKQRMKLAELFDKLPKNAQGVIQAGCGGVDHLRDIPSENVPWALDMARLIHEIRAHCGHDTERIREAIQGIKEANQIDSLSGLGHSEINDLLSDYQMGFRQEAPHDA